MLRTIALRLTGTEAAREELASLGEDVDDFIVTTTSKMDKQIRDLTKTQNGFGVSLLDMNGNYRSTYDVLLDIAEIWDRIAEEDLVTGENRQNAWLEMMAGKNRSNILASILQSPDVLKEAYAAALDSEGSALKENEAYLESIQGHIAQIKNLWDNLWVNENNREFVNFFLDIAKSVLESINNFGVLKSLLIGGGGVIAVLTKNALAAKDVKISFKGLTSALLENAKKLAGWLAANPITSWTLLATGAIIGLVAIVDALGTTVEEQRKKLEDFKKEYNEITSELKSLNDELSTTEQRMKELEQIDSLSFAEQEEYDNLVKTNNELQRKIDLLELEEKIKSQDVRDAFVSTMEKETDGIKDKSDEYFYYVDPNDPNRQKNVGKGSTFLYSTGGYSIEAIPEQELVSVYENYSKRLTELDEQYANDLENKAYKKTRETLEEEMSDLAIYLQDKITQFNIDSEGISYISKPTSTADKNVNEWLDYINDFQDRMAIAMGGSNAKTNAFNRIVDNWKFDDAVQGLQALGEEGKVTADMLDDPNYDKFIQKLVYLGVIDSADNLEDIALAFNKVTEAIPPSEDLPVSFEDIFTLENANGDLSNLGKLNEQVDKLQTAWTGLKEMMDNYNKTGTITVDQFQELLSYGDEYLQYLMDEQGNLRLNEEALKKVAAAKIENMKADILQKMFSNLENITNEATARDFLADKINNETLAIAENTEALKENIRTKLKDLATNGNLTASTMTSIKNYVNNTMSVIDKLGDSISFGSFYGKDVEKDVKESIDAYMDYMKASLDAGKIDYQAYSREVAAYLKDMFDKGKIAAEDYHNYTKQMLEVQKSVYDGALSAIQDLLDDEIEKIDDSIEAIEKKNEALEKQKEKYDAVISAVVDFLNEEKDKLQDNINLIEDENDLIDKQIEKYDQMLNAVTLIFNEEREAIEAQQEAIDERIEALQDENDEHKKAIELEKAKFALEQAQQQRNKKLYVGERGYIYDVDRDAVRDSKEQLSDLEFDATIDALEKERELLDDILGQLDEAEESWAKISNAFDNQKNLSAAEELFGADYKDIILGANPDTIESIMNQYTSAQQKLEDNDATIESIEEQKQKYDELIEKWESVATAKEDATNREIAAAILGQEWQRIILEERTVDFDNFKNNYLAIQEQILSNEAEILSLEEKKILYQDLKEQWSDITSTYEKERNKLYAAQILGADWEKDVLNGRKGQLEIFKNDYIAIQDAIIQKAYEAAEAVKKANSDISGSNVGGLGESGSNGVEGLTGNAELDALLTSDVGKNVGKNLNNSIPHGWYAVDNQGNIVSGTYSSKQDLLDEYGARIKNGHLTAKQYAKGGKNLEKQLAWTNEYDKEVVFSPSRNAILTPIEPGDSVLNPKMTENLWKWAEINPNMFNPLVKSMDYSNIPVRNDIQHLTISIGDIQLYGVQDVNDLGNQIVKRLPNVMLQAINKR